MVWSFFPTCRA